MKWCWLARLSKHSETFRQANAGREQTLFFLIDIRSFCLVSLNNVSKLIDFTQICFWRISDSETRLKLFEQKSFIQAIALKAQHQL